jgi:hypothetical protein
MNDDDDLEWCYVIKCWVLRVVMGTAMVRMVVIVVEVERIAVYRHDCGREAPQARTHTHQARSTTV